MNLSKAIRRRLVMFGAAAAATLAIAVPAIAGQYLSASAFTMPTNPTAPKNGVYYASDYKSVEEMQKAARETVRQMGQESTVLLKKSDKGLLTQGMNVTIFGKNSVNPIYLGTGSGSATFYDGVANETVDLYQALEADGVHVNPAMKAFYETNALSGNGRPTGGQGSGMPQWNERSFGWPVGETSPEKFANAPDESYNVYGDAAVIMFSRIGGEGYDLPRSSWDYNRGANGANIRTEAGESVPVVNGIPKAVEGRSVYSDPACTTKATASSEAFYTESYLQLDDYERALLKSVKDSGKFDKIIVLINSANAMDLTDLDDPQYGVDDVLWVGYPGLTGFEGVADVLTGKVAPSGRLVDTYLTDYRYDPTVNNSSVGDTSVLYKADEKTATEDMKGINEGDKYYSLFGTNAYILSEDYTVNNEGGVATPAILQDYTYEEGDYSFNRYVKYKEGVFMGYRYFESVRTAMNGAGVDGDAWYDSVVQYPFGYGLTTAEFDQEIKMFYTKGTGMDLSFNFQVKVTNTSETVAGKDVVQLFASLPSGELSKTSIMLAAFDKTETLQPGESTEVTISFYAYDLASFDMEAGHYVLEDGTYTFSLGGENGVADGQANAVGTDNTKKATYNFKEDFKFVDDKGKGIDPDTGSEVKTRINQYNIVTGTTSEIEGQVLTNDTLLDANKNAVIPAADTEAQRTKNGAFIQKLFDTNYKERLASQDDENDPWYNNTDPRDKGEGVNVNTANDNPIEITVTAKDLVGLPYDDAKYETLLDEMTIQELGQLTQNSHKTGVPRLGIPAHTSGDGPAGIHYGGSLEGRFDGVGHIMMAASVNIATTWNIDLSYMHGRLVGNDGIWSEVTLWLGPGANMHRNAFGGRNYEYYSEDVVITGQMLAEVCKGAREMGLITAVKHFSLNDQDTDRESDSLVTFADEQTAREIYFRPFEIAVKKYQAEGLGCNGLMTSFNRYGNTFINNLREINVDILRGEWGFEGSMVTDATNRWMTGDAGLRGGGIVMLGGGSNYYWPSYVLASDYDGMTATQLNLLREAAHGIVYSIINSNAMNATPGYYDENGNVVAITTYDQEQEEVVTEDPNAPVLDKVDSAVNDLNGKVDGAVNDINGKVDELSGEIDALNQANKDLQAKNDSLQTITIVALVLVGVVLVVSAAGVVMTFITKKR